MSFHSLTSNIFASHQCGVLCRTNTREVRLVRLVVRDSCGHTKPNQRHETALVRVQPFSTVSPSKLSIVWTRFRNRPAELDAWVAMTVGPKARRKKHLWKMHERFHSHLVPMIPLGRQDVLFALELILKAMMEFA